MDNFRPIEKAFTPHKAREWHFKIHPFFTKQPSNVVKKYIEHFTKKGELVCDPFAGTGVTAIECLSSNRKIITTDIDPLAIFITRQTCISPININKLQNAFNDLNNSMAEIVEFARNSSDKSIEKHKIKEWYPKNVKLPKNSDFKYVEDLFDKRQLIVFAKLLDEINQIRDTTIKNLLKLVFSNTLGKANLTYMDNLARGEEGGGSSIFGKYRYWKPQKSKIVDVWKNYEKRFYYLKQAKEECNKHIGEFYKENENVWIYKHSATKLTEVVKENSVDYIYTDPPYGAHIAYLDLSTMWNAWLGFKVTENDKREEVIEGGDIQHSKDDYLGLLNECMIEMYKALKKDKWLSLVFHHKEARLWYAIRDSAKNTGFEYVNTVAQPTATTSIHKKMNPLKVLGEQLIINFQKTKKSFPSAAVNTAQPILKVIYNAAEREIIRNSGATLEEIMRGVVPDLFELNLIDKVALKSSSDISQLLESEFELGIDDKWYIKKENQEKIGHYIPIRERIRYYMVSLLRRENKLDFDTIVTTLMPLLENGRQPSHKEILDVLQEVGISKDGFRWQLRNPEELVVQPELGLKDIQREAARMPKGSIHNQILFRLICLGKKLNLKVYIGKKERTSVKEFSRDKDLLTELPLDKLTAIQKKRIQEIDCIWFYQNAPLFAFEVEASTPVLSALERFYHLLEVSHSIGHERHLVVVAPNSRKRKLTQELTESSYVGHPTRMELKICYLYFENLIKDYNGLISKNDLTIADINRILELSNLLTE